LFNPTRINKPKSLSKIVVEKIKESILNGSLKPGAKLIETQLTSSLGVSRTPLREAFRELAVEGYITIYPHKGAFVTKITKEEIKDLYMITSVLEGLATRLATPLLSLGKNRKHLEKLLEELRTYEQSGEVSKYWETNQLFHRFITNSCKNEKLKVVISNLRRQILKTRIITLKVPGRLTSSMKEHENILELILNNEARKAEKMVIKHLELQGKILYDLTDKPL
tara:strand:+ start:119 stop:790 length:672 start_codon:yes stop_codon:yes gene_type:complete